jgi:hypothetical protein
VRFVQILRRGIDVLHQRPEQARRIYLDHTDTHDDDPLTNAIIAATLPCFTHDFSMAPAYYEQLEAWMHRYGLIDTTHGGDAYWTNDFALPTRPPIVSAQEA